jgi:hypothetical protein
MGERRRIQLLPAQPPLRQVVVHHGDEAFVVTSLDEMGELVDDDIFEALLGLLDTGLMILIVRYRRL